MPADITSMGKITCNRVNIATNQTFMLACPIATSEQATDFGVQWGVDGSALTVQDSYEQGVSYKNLTFDKAGTYRIKCVATYRYGSEGVKVKEQFSEIRIKNAQFRGILLGDDIETAKAKNPNMEHISLFPTAQYYSDVVSPTLTYYFFFEKDKLDIGRTNELLPASSDSPQTVFARQCDKYSDITPNPSIRIEPNWDPATGMLYKPTEQEKLIFEKFSKKSELSQAEQDVLSQLMDRYLIEMIATMPFLDDEKVYIEIRFSASEVNVNQYTVTTFIKSVTNQNNK